MVQQTTRYGMSISVPAAYETTLERVRAALGRAGFGILAEMDIAATLKKKLDVDFRPYIILGACNPPLAYRALLAEPDIGLLLPCNVVVYAGDEPGHTTVAAMDPVEALDLTGNAAIRPIAEDVGARIRRVLEDVERGDDSAAPGR